MPKTIVLAVSAAALLCSLGVASAHDYRRVDYRYDSRDHRDYHREQSRDHRAYHRDEAVLHVFAHGLGVFRDRYSHREFHRDLDWRHRDSHYEQRRDHRDYHYDTGRYYDRYDDRYDCGRRRY